MSDVSELRRAGVGPLALAVVERRERGASWRDVCADLGVSRGSARGAWAEAQRRLHAHREAHYGQREAVVALGEEARGWPAVGIGIRGAIADTVPGGPAWRLAR